MKTNGLIADLSALRALAAADGDRMTALAEVIAHDRETIERLRREIESLQSELRDARRSAGTMEAAMHHAA